MKMDKKELLAVVLQDGPGETGGVSYLGETLQNFLEEANLMHLLDEENPLAKINEALIECGIEPIKK